MSLNFGEVDDTKGGITKGVLGKFILMDAIISPMGVHGFWSLQLECLVQVASCLILKKLS